LRTAVAETLLATSLLRASRTFGFVGPLAET
jgi:hypothetical protein